MVWQKKMEKNHQLQIFDPVNYIYIVGGFNPIETYARQIGSSPQGPGWK